MPSSAGQSKPQVARAAARYRPGKAPVNAGQLDSSDEDGEDVASEEEQHNGRPHDLTQAAQQRRTAGVVIQSGDGPIQAKSVQVKLHADERKPVDVDGVSSSEYETDSDQDTAPAAAKPVFRRPGDAGRPSAAQGPGAPSSSSGEYETDSEDDDEDARPAMLKPIFVPKSRRDAGASATQAQTATQPVHDEEEAERKAKEEAQQRKAESHMLAAERIKQQQLSESRPDGEQPELSDTDDKDPEAEFAAWRVRELTRIKREREAEAEREAERSELERRRAMPEAQRLAEDTERARKSRTDKQKHRNAADGDGPAFMQKYYHKGSFFQDMDILSKRNYAAATESAVDKTLLPSVMQVRDYGKKSRSKWTHLANEDTSRKDGGSGGGGGAGGAHRQRDGSAANTMACFACGGPHLRRDCPQQNSGGSRSGNHGHGANTVPVTRRHDQSLWNGRHDDDEHRDRRRSQSPQPRRRDKVRPSRA